MSGWLTAHFLKAAAPILKATAPVLKTTAPVLKATAPVPKAAASAAACALVASIAGCGQSGPPGGQGSPGRPASPAAFLSAYVRPDGRVLRPDQGGDTVSEGQAYGMLLAEVARDNGAFNRIWGWTRAHLERGDGLFAYHADAAGHVVDPQPASDADVLIAWALLRYHGANAAALHGDGRRVANAVLAHEVTPGPGGEPVLAAGPWATGRPATLNPSYWSLAALQGLATLTGDTRWQRLAGAAVSLTQQFTQGGRLLPPDWAELTAAGQLRPEPAPNGAVPQAQYGLDAQRTVVWFAIACNQQARALSARWWPKLKENPQAQAIALNLDGGVLNGSPSVLPLVAAASAAHAADDRAASESLLHRAGQQQRTDPTYYGGAWAALGPALLSGGALAHC
ncbi:MAG: glycosyl hydrolase family 8 [Micromonosporaceae bacterium]